MTSFVYDQITYVLFSNYTAEVGYNVPNAAQIPENLVIPQHVPYNNNNYLVTSVCQSAFFQVLKMKTVQLPESIIIIKNNAFDQSYIPGDLFQIPSGVKIMENYCFATNSFKKVIIPKTVESIGICPFGNNLNLETIEVEEGSRFFVTDSQNILYN